jgi:hypothetical protein
VALAVALLGAAGCGGGGDGDGGGDGAGGLDLGGEGGAGDPAASPGSERDACSLLEVAEVEEHFGERGAVADGAPNLSGTTVLCSWAVGEPAAPDGGTVVLGVSDTVTDAIFDELDGEPVPGLGNEALLSPSVLHVRAGETYFNLSVGFYPEVPGTGDKLTALGQAVVDRL